MIRPTVQWCIYIIRCNPILIMRDTECHYLGNFEIESPKLKLSLGNFLDISFGGILVRKLTGEISLLSPQARGWCFYGAGRLLMWDNLSWVLGYSSLLISEGLLLDNIMFIPTMCTGWYRHGGGACVVGLHTIKKASTNGQHIGYLRQPIDSSRRTFRNGLAMVDYQT